MMNWFELLNNRRRKAIKNKQKMKYVFDLLCCYESGKWRVDRGNIVTNRNYVVVLPDKW